VKNIGRPRLTWMNDVIERTGLKTYENVKMTAEDRDKWRAIASTFFREGLLAKQSWSCG